MFVMKTIDQFTIRKQNICRLWEVLDSRASVTRQELAEKTSLSLMTVTNLVDHLNRYHVLSFAAPALDSSVGRKTTGRHADIISLNREDHAWLLVDLTDRHFRFFALALDRSVLYSGPAWDYDGQRDYTQNLRDFLRRCRAGVDKEMKKREILGVGVVVPGPYDISGDMVRNKRVPELNRVLVKETLRRELGMYDYYVDEDVKFAVRAYMFLAAQSGSELLYYLYIGEGVGGAASHAGNVLRGLNAAAGDAGQMLTALDTPFEAALSLRAFADALGLTDVTDLSEDALLARMDDVAYQNPAGYREALLRMAALTGKMLYSVVWMLDPKQIVIDCRYAEPMEEEYIARIRETLVKALGGALGELPELVPAMRGRRSVLSGAAQVLTREWINRIV